MFSTEEHCKIVSKILSFVSLFSIDIYSVPF